MSDIDYDALDPGIRDTVRLLRSRGFDTVDSGDGVSKAGDPCALDYPHVFIATTKGTMFGEADLAARVLGPAWSIEASYAPRDGSCVILVIPAPSAEQVAALGALEVTQ